MSLPATFIVSYLRCALVLFALLWGACLSNQVSYASAWASVEYVRVNGSSTSPQSLSNNTTAILSWSGTAVAFAGGGLASSRCEVTLKNPSNVTVYSTGVTRNNAGGITVASSTNYTFNTLGQHTLSLFCEWTDQQTPEYWSDQKTVLIDVIAAAGIPAPTDLTASNITQTDVSLYWANTASGRTDIYYQTGGLYTGSGWDLYRTAATGATSGTLNGLRAGTMYGFRLEHVVGGIRSAPSEGIELATRLDPTAYGVSQVSWPVKPMSIQRDGAAAGVINGKLYVAGGLSGNTYANSVEVYDPSTNEWATLSGSMVTPRYTASAGVINGKLYVAGGYRGMNALNTIEEYNPATDTWRTLTGTMSVPRQEAAAGVINGKLYVAGGYSGGSMYLDTIEEYNPATDTWRTLTGTMSAKLVRASAGVINGKLYVAGGYNGSTYINTIQEYNPATDTWRTLTGTMSVARHGAAMELIGWEFYLVGGQNSTSVSLPTEAYNPATDTWRTLSSGELPARRINTSAGVINGKLYVAGGLSLGNRLSLVEWYDFSVQSGPFAFAAMRSARDNAAAGVIDGKLYVVGGRHASGLYSSWGEVYNSATDSWSGIVNMSTPRLNPVAGVINGKLYVAGWYSGSTTLSWGQVYNPANDSWSPIASMLIPRYAAAAGVIDGKLYVVGGRNGSTTLSWGEVYNPANDSWSPLPNMSTSRYYHTASVINGKLYVAGGANSVYLSWTEVYNPSTGSWSTVSPMPTARWYVWSVAINGKLYVLGGFNWATWFNTVDIYNPASDSWNTSPAMSLARGGMAAGLINGRIYVAGGYTYTNTVLSSVESYAPWYGYWGGREFSMTLAAAAQTGIPVPLSLTGTSVTQTGVDLRWTNTPSNLKTNIYYQTGGTASGWTLKNITSASGATGAVISGLSPSTTYGFQVRNVDTSEFIKIETNRSYSCGITTTGDLKCWWNNDNGNIGNNSTGMVLSPVQVLTGWVTAIALPNFGSSSTCALQSGTVKCWGDNDYGQLGDGTTLSRLYPVVALSGGVTKLSSNGTRVCAIQSGNLKCWGYNDYWQVGNNSTTNALSPVQVLTSGVEDVSAKWLYTTCAIQSGNLKCWGEGGYVGDGTTVRQQAPVTVLSGNVTRLANWVGSTCAIQSGNLKCWWHNDNSQLWFGWAGMYYSPVQSLTGGVSEVYMGDSIFFSTTCAIQSGNLKCGGNGARGHSGSAYSLAVTLTGAITDVSLDGVSSCAIQSGNLKCWGSFPGASGDSTFPLSILTGGVTDIASGGCAIQSGNLKCWGENQYGRIWDGTTSNRSTPVDIRVSVESSPSNSITITTLAVAINSFTVSPTTITNGSSALLSWTTSGATSCTVTGPAGAGVPSAPANTITGSTGSLSVTPTTNGNKTYTLTCGGATRTANLQVNNAAVNGQCGPAATNYAHSATAFSGALCTQWTASPASPAFPAQGSSASWACQGSGGGSDIVCTAQRNPSPVPHSLTGTVLGETSASLSWQNTPSEYTANIYYQLGGTGGTWLRKSTDNGSGQTNVLLQGLVAGTTYAFQVRNVNQNENVYTDVSAGNSHTCAITQAGAVKCWGNNNYGQLGNGTTAESYTPTDVEGISSGAVRVFAGALNTCAIMQDGSVKCWGYNGYRQLTPGGPSNAGQLTPVTMSGVTNITNIALGYYSICVLWQDTSVKCWGHGGYGQIGDGTFASKSTPVVVPGLETGVAEISGNYLSMCARMLNGTVKCWWFNRYGQVGDGLSSTGNVSVPTDVVGITDAQGLASGLHHACAIVSGGAVKCWWRNAVGELWRWVTTGDNPNSTPVLVTGLSGATKIWLGGYHSCVDTSSGPKCWGYNPSGQLWDGTNSSRSSPVSVVDIPAGSQLAPWVSHTCARVPNGSLKCWGDNLTGQLWVASQSAQSSPSAVVFLSGALKVSGGDRHSCAITASGSVKCWGYNGQWQLWDGTNNTSGSPVDVVGLTGAIDIVAGSLHTCALLDNGSVKCWWYNAQGQLGDNSNVSRNTPVDVSGLTSWVVQISAGIYHTCALSDDNGVKCWWYNAQGQLGDSSNTWRRVPVDVTGLNGLSVGVISIGAGGYHTCAVTQQNTIKCWGRDGYPDGEGGYVANSQSVDSNQPIDMLGIDDAVAVSLGLYHACTITNGGGVKCWWFGGHYALGNGSSTSTITPVTALWLSEVVSMTTGYYHNCAVTVDNAVKCWGHGGYGQLGNGSTSSATTPLAVTGFGSAQNMGAGTIHTCWVDTFGIVRCTGRNEYGTLGDGTVFIPPSTPQDVLQESSPSNSIMLTTILNGVCGSAARSYGYNETDYAGALCAAGSVAPASPAFPYYGQTTSWTCNGRNGGSNMTCSASREIPPPPTTKLTVNGMTTTSVDPGVSFTLTWTGTYVSGCMASSSPTDSSWNGAKSPTGSMSRSLLSTGSYAYTLVCNNVSGTSSATVNVTVSVAAPRDLDGTVTSPTDAFLTWTSGGPYVTHISYQTGSTNGTWVDLWNYASGVTSAAVSSLAPDTMYYFRARHSQGTSFSAYSNVISLTTMSSSSTTCTPWTRNTDGTIDAFELFGTCYVTTPGNCSDTSSPLCDGGTDAIVKTWWHTSTSVGATSASDGAGNTRMITEAGSAARYCADMEYAGYGDWFLPATDQMNALYAQRAPIGGFASGLYWTSTESTANRAWYQSGNHLKTNADYVRCVRVKGIDTSGGGGGGGSFLWSCGVYSGYSGPKFPLSGLVRYNAMTDVGNSYGTGDFNVGGSYLAADGTFHGCFWHSNVGWSSFDTYGSGDINQPKLLPIIGGSAQATGSTWWEYVGGTLLTDLGFSPTNRVLYSISSRAMGGFGYSVGAGWMPLSGVIIGIFTPMLVVQDVPNADAYTNTAPFTIAGYTVPTATITARLTYPDGSVTPITCGGIPAFVCNLPALDALGTYTFEVISSYGSYGQSRHTQQITRVADIFDPQVNIVLNLITPQGGMQATNQILTTGMVSSGAIVRVQMNGSTPINCTVTSSLLFSCPALFLPNQSDHIITVTAIDRLDPTIRTTESRLVRYEALAPRITVTAPLSAYSTGTTIVGPYGTGSWSDTATVEMLQIRPNGTQRRVACSIAWFAWSCPRPTNTSGYTGPLEEGQHTLIFTATDSSGRVTHETRVIWIDRTPPTAIFSCPTIPYYASNAYALTIYGDDLGGSPIASVNGTFESDSVDNSQTTLTGVLHGSRFSSIRSIKELERDTDYLTNRHRVYTLNISSIVDAAGNVSTTPQNCNITVVPDLSSTGITAAIAAGHIALNASDLSVLSGGVFADGQAKNLGLVLRDQYGNDLISNSGAGIPVTVDLTYANSVYADQQLRWSGSAVAFDNSGTLTDLLMGPSVDSQFTQRLNSVLSAANTSPNHTLTFHPFAPNARGYAAVSGSLPVSDSDADFTLSAVTARVTMYAGYTEPLLIPLTPTSFAFKPIVMAAFDTSTKQNGVIIGNYVAGFSQASIASAPAAASSITPSASILGTDAASFRLYHAPSSGTGTIIGNCPSPLSAPYRCRPGTTTFGYRYRIEQIGTDAFPRPNVALASHLTYAVNGRTVTVNTDVVGMTGGYWWNLGSASSVVQIGLNVAGAVTGRASAITAGQIGSGVNLLGDLDTSVNTTNLRRNALTAARGLNFIPGAPTASAQGFVYQKLVDPATAVSNLTFNGLEGTPFVMHRRDTIDGNTLIISSAAGTGTVVLDAPMGWSSMRCENGIKRTLLVIGADLYIGSNITYASLNSDILGIVVISDELGRGGNIYIDSDVTNISATIYAQKAVMSAARTSSTSFEVLDGLSDISRLSNQLDVYGSLIASNTIGGSSVLPQPLCPNYVPKALCTVERAQRYDLNYLRRYYLFDTDGDGDREPANGGGSSYNNADLNNSSLMAQYGEFPVVIRFNPTAQVMPPPLFMTAAE